jgi:hypothetical protein
MNERIKELADEAKMSTYLLAYGVEFNISIEKFAELIVKECLEACSRANEIRHFVPPTQEQVVLSCMREIEEYFGIESQSYKIICDRTNNP